MLLHAVLSDTGVHLSMQSLEGATNLFAPLFMRSVEIDYQKRDGASKRSPSEGQTNENCHELQSANSILTDFMNRQPCGQW